MTSASNIEPTSIDKLVTFIPLTVGPFAIFGSCAILYNILSDPQRRFTTPFYRIMFALSVSDLSYAITRLTSTFAIPKDTPGYFYASGNQATCDAQGFFIHLGLTEPMYTASLCIYFLLVIKYSKSDEYISKKIEPWMHIVSIGYPLVTAIASVSLKLYNPAFLGCMICEYPERCNTLDETSCLRGHNASFHLWLYFGLVLISSCIIICWSMIAIVLFIRTREQTINRRLSFANNDISRSQRLAKQYSSSARQAVLYIFFYLLAWGFGVTARIFSMYSEKQLLGLLVVHQLTNQLLGFFNFVIYIIPRFSIMKNENKHKPFRWILKESITMKTRNKALRRASRFIILDQQRRIDHRL